MFPLPSMPKYLWYGGFLYPLLFYIPYKILQTLFPYVSQFDIMLLKSFFAYD